MPGGAAGALGAARLLGRNWPLVVLLVVIGGLFWPTKDAVADGDMAGAKPYGSDHMPSTMRH
jgi:hypothetical protein